MSLYSTEGLLRFSYVTVPWVAESSQQPRHGPASARRGDTQVQDDYGTSVRHYTLRAPLTRRRAAPPHLARITNC